MTKRKNGQNDMWLMYYRGAMLGLISLVMGMVAWQSNRIIVRQDETAKQISELREDVSVEQTRVMNLVSDVAASKAEITKSDVRLTRTNERQTEMLNDLAVVKSQVDDLRAKVK